MGDLQSRVSVSTALNGSLQKKERYTAHIFRVRNASRVFVYRTIAFERWRGVRLSKRFGKKDLREKSALFRNSSFGS